MKKTIKIKIRDRQIAGIIAHTIIGLAALVCFIPFILVIVASFTSEAAIMRDGFRLIPTELSLEAYAFVFNDLEEILNIYKNSIVVTVIGTTISVLLSSMTAYVLARKDFKLRNKLAFYYFFTTIFSGGLVPWYILCVRYLHFKEMPYVALIIPLLFNFFYIVIMRSFISSTILDSLIESAKIDGASDFCIYWKIVLPLSKSIIATIVLFTAMGYWNDYYNPMLFTSDEAYVTLQYHLYKMLGMMKAASAVSQSAVNINYPAETFKMAMTVISVGPILLVYPFVQKYLVKGVMVGAVKG